MRLMRLCAVTVLLFSVAACEEGGDDGMMRTAALPLGESSEAGVNGAKPANAGKNAAFMESVESLMAAHPELAAAIASSKPGPSASPMASTAAVPSADSGVCREDAPRVATDEAAPSEYVPTSFSSNVPLRQRLAHRKSTSPPSPTSKAPLLSGAPDDPSEAPPGVKFGPFSYRAMGD
ncbi:MAG: hypothetical protein H6744_14700 [Deltaproteobacteria bacterium]|nr:hypothetical protein [Deltaproteobacteria bacterium]MCB9787931.1 hypothetical protein [Deltaproteobacteria bacterium]